LVKGTLWHGAVIVFRITHNPSIRALNSGLYEQGISFAAGDGNPFLKEHANLAQAVSRCDHSRSGASF